MQAFVHDIECLSNCFTQSFVDYKEDTWHEFVIHKTRNDFIPLVRFLLKMKEQSIWMVSFNGIAYDSPLNQFIIDNRDYLVKLSGDAIAREIFKESQRIINYSNENGWPELREDDLYWKQLDLFKLAHWDNPAKRSSLKWIMYAIDWINVQEMPYHFTMEIETEFQISQILSYNRNDVMATKHILHLFKPEIGLRNNLQRKYDLPCLSWSDSKIGESLLKVLYEKRTGLKVGRKKTNRKKIDFKDIIFPYIQYKSPDFTTFLESLRSTTIKKTKGEFKYQVKFRGYKWKFGAGGVHQSLKGIFEEDETHCIEDIDVGSMYTSVGCSNKLFPAHLGEPFYEVFKTDLVDVRLAEKAKKENGDKTIVESFKLAGNASVGKSNNQYSWLRDSQYFMAITLNGQLVITMLVEDILLNFPDAQLLQTNTDGLTIRIKRSDRPALLEICKHWEEITRLNLEYASYKKVFLWDVNNYIAVYTDDKVKCKGRFEWKEQKEYKTTHLHKNKSFLIIPMAIYNYFINDITPERFLMENRNIYDYCAGLKSNVGIKHRQLCLNKGKHEESDLQKVVRYYISTEGCRIIKYLSDGSRQEIDAREYGYWMKTVFNAFEKKEWNDYKVNDDYYLEKIYQEIGNIKPMRRKDKNQPELFD